MITNERPHDMSVKQTVAPDHKKHWGLLEGSTHLPQMTLLCSDCSDQSAWQLEKCPITCTIAVRGLNYDLRFCDIVFENPFLYEDKQHIL